MTIMQIMKRGILVALSCICVSLSHAQIFSGEYTTEWQLDMKKNTNWMNLLRLHLDIPLWEGRGMLQASTIHIAKTDESVANDWQIFSNIEEENDFAAIAVLGYMHNWKAGHLFVGVRNAGEDFFTSSVTSLFINSSCGMFPTISASYPIANYPRSGLTVYFDVNLSGWVFRNSLYNGVAYDGWNAKDNPFIVRPARDGIFDISQLEYSHKGGRYFAGVAVHTRHYPVGEDGTMAPADASCRQASCAWWVYGEQKVWTSGDRDICCMAQYSENTCRTNGCRRYAETGCAYHDSNNECGVSGQYARFYQGTECSVEVTWKRKINKAMALQPSFQYITNGDGNFTVLSARLYYSF